MNLKLYVWHCELYKDPKQKYSLFAMAEDEKQAKEVILERIKNDDYKLEVSKFFDTTLRPPSVYGEVSAFILHEGVPMLL